MRIQNHATPHESLQQSEDGGHSNTPIQIRCEETCIQITHLFNKESEMDTYSFKLISKQQIKSF